MQGCESYPRVGCGLHRKKLAWVILSGVAEEEGPEAQEDPAGVLSSMYQYPWILEEDGKQLTTGSIY